MMQHTRWSKRPCSTIFRLATVWGVLTLLVLAISSWAPAAVLL